MSIPKLSAEKCILSVEKFLRGWILENKSLSQVTGYLKNLQKTIFLYYSSFIKEKALPLLKIPFIWVA